MRTLRLALQLNILYMGLAVLLGEARSPEFNALAAFAAASFFAGLLLLTSFIPRLVSGASRDEVQTRRYAVAALLVIPAAVLFALAHGVLLGNWRGPSRLTGLYTAVMQFAGAWSLVLLLVLPPAAQEALRRAWLQR